MSRVILEANDINKSYFDGNKKLDVLIDFSIILKEKEIITITGHSGCGKSTALNILGTLDKFDSGELKIENKNVKLINDSDISILRNESIGFVFQFHHLLPEFTALENVMIPTWIKGKKDNIKYAMELFSDLGLKSSIDSFPSQLSGGERSRIALIRAIINKPKILFADEPTGNLDEGNASKLMALLTKINKDYDQSIILTTHNPEVAKMGHKKYKLDNGRLKE